MSGVTLKAEGVDSFYDLDRLAHAVACAETSCGRDGTAIHRNNHFGIMCWKKDGSRFPCYFDSKAESYAAFKRIWAKSYKSFPDMAMARRWTGDDNAESWLHTVRVVYSSH